MRCSAAATSAGLRPAPAVSAIIGSWPPREPSRFWTGPKRMVGRAARHLTGADGARSSSTPRRRVEALAFGAGWDTEYPRDTWRLRNLGIDRPEATVDFADIPQPWLRDLAKGCPLAAGSRAQRQHGRAGARAVTRFAVFLPRSPALPARQPSTARCWSATWPPCAPSSARQRVPWPHVAALNGFLRRSAGTAGTTHPAGQRGDLPRGLPPQPGTRLPRALAGHVMAQVEQPANLARRDNPAYRLITMILIRCGLRISDAAAALRLRGHRRRRRPLPALLQHQDETRGPRAHRRRTAPDRRPAAAGAARWPAGPRCCSPGRSATWTGRGRRPQHLPGQRSTAGWRPATSATSTASPST